MKRRLAASLLALALTGAGLAHHAHYLLTPGTCVEDIASGQTSKTEGEGGHHQFHDNVHLGVPGASAFPETEHVAVGKGTCPTQ